jgi:glutaredoxin 3
MPKIEIYSATYCPYCVRAKDLLNNKGVSYNEFLVDVETKKRDEMLSRSNGRKTVPQIFINDKHIGGFDDLKAIDDDGNLDSLLSS